jgi:hypothetical protein
MGTDLELFTIREPGGQYTAGYSGYGYGCNSNTSTPMMVSPQFAKMWASIAPLKAHLSSAGRQKYKAIKAEVVAFGLVENWVMSIDDVDALRKMPRKKREQYLEVLKMRNRIERIKSEAMRIQDMERELRDLEDEFAQM